MRNRLLVAAVVTVVAGICGPAAAAGAPAGDQDTTFVNSSHQGNLAEIAAGQDAQEHATTSCVKDVGAKLVTDHEDLDSDLKALATKSGMTLPTAPTVEQQQKLIAIQDEAGTAEYDTAWLADQEAAHTKTLALIDTQIRAGSDTAVTNAAQKARPVVAMHLEMVRGGTCHPM
ncbi:DUF4142 domain-containing protein [Streptomyces sp. ISL-66]|uniref:DUF4142 domain-containing protein n=1 Tax=Streptomyces sp. ISL-66 TaxID=2819186 RepID=UPI001BEC03F0|nr:DUF4142 domain-containing protein [Streptomyces sp. ISL-66]MBT2470542.1 DUF4142 domain-containing protein [Streptomyces sp. ISL-66]